MKKIITTLAVAALASVSASAQNIVGWDFSQYTNDGFSSVDGVNLTGSLTANYANGAANFVTAASLGTLFYNGTNGSTAFNLSAGEVSPQSSLDTTVGNQGYLGTSGSLATLQAQGQLAPVQANTFGLSVDGAFTFSLTPGSATDFSAFEYTAFNTNDAATTLAWDYSIDGGTSFTALETDNISTTQSAFSVDLSSITNQSSVLVRGTLSGLDSNLFQMDNVAVSGTVVPEPSTYAAIFGVIALGFAAYRRRKN